MTRRRVASIPLVSVGRGVWRSEDGLFEFMSEASSTRLGFQGWCVRSLLGVFADPDGRFEPLVLDNGLSWARTLRECVVLAYRLKWEWIRHGALTHEELDAALQEVGR